MTGAVVAMTTLPGRIRCGRCNRDADRPGTAGRKDQEPVTAPTVVFDGDKYRIKAGDQVVEEGTFDHRVGRLPCRPDTRPEP
jgi:hypothetical protein